MLVRLALESAYADLYIAGGPDWSMTLPIGDVTVWLRVPRADEQHWGPNRPDAMCGASLRTEITDSTITDVLTSIETLGTQHKVPSGSYPDTQALPDSFTIFSGQSYAHLHELVEQVVRVTCWRCGLPGLHSPRLGQKWMWTRTDQDWFWMPNRPRAWIRDADVIHPATQPLPEVAALVNAGASQPLGHELFREAWALRRQNPRSALIMAIAAGEVGFKSYVTSMIPDATWLMDNLQSPPLHVMVANYLHLIPSKLSLQGTVKTLPRAVRRALQSGVELRNRLIHRGQGDPTSEQLDEIMAAVRDLLWLLDYYSGHQWALNYLRDDTIQSMSQQ